MEGDTVSPHTTSSPRLMNVVDSDRAHWLELPAHRSSARTARRFVSARLTEWRLADQLCEEAVLIVSELATNALCHAAGTRILCGVGLISDRWLRLEVHDHDYNGGTLSRCAPGPDDEGGRGLLLVQEIADDWGVDRSALTGGKAVWATLTTSY